MSHWCLRGKLLGEPVVGLHVEVFGCRREEEKFECEEMREFLYIFSPAVWPVWSNSLEKWLSDVAYAGC